MASTLTIEIGMNLTAVLIFAGLVTMFIAWVGWGPN